MDTLRNWFSSHLGSTFQANQDALLKWEANSMDEMLAESDQLKARARINTNPLDRERVSFNTRVTQVDINDRNNMFIPPWKALYLEKHGKLARIGYFQHVEVDESTVFTRARAAKKAADEAGEFIPN